MDGAVLHTVGLPTLEAGRVELAVDWVKATAHLPGGELQGELDHAALGNVADAFLEDAKEGGLAIGEVEHAAFEGTPLLAGDPSLSAVGVVDVIRNPAEVCAVLGGRGVFVRKIRNFNEVTRLREMDIVSRHPGALVVAVRDFSVGADAHTVRGPDARGVDFELLTVWGDLEDAAMVFAKRTPAAATRIHGAAL